jgi:hypothetical protein
METMNRIAVCSPYVRSFGLLRDAPSPSKEWESFSPESVPEYFTDGVQALRQHLIRLEDISKPYTAADETRLWFMVESLIQARRLIEETRLDSQENNV